MAKLTPRNNNNNRPCCDVLHLLPSSLIALLLLWTLWSTRTHIVSDPNNTPISNRAHGPPDQTFYDDPDLSYSIEKPLRNWDEKRKEWLRLHPSLAAGSKNRILLVTGSQPSPCKNRIGDHLLLRCFKNKVDYSRIHGYDIFYNNLYLHPKMDSYWAKLPIIRAAMMAHPDAEWIWWMDADAVFTDMEFKIPLDRYKDHNFVVHGWPNMVYEDKDNKSWTGLNVGSYLIRNCQWSMDLMQAWAKMGPNTPNYEKWGRILKSTFKDKPFPLPDDQSSFIYMLSTDRARWEKKTYLEGRYDLEAYWMGVVDRFEEMTEDKRWRRRRHAEKVSAWYGGLREGEEEEYGNGTGMRRRRPFVTHFTGCQPCNGEHNPNYDGTRCWKEMERALNFADNQVMRNYGFVHHNLGTSSVSHLQF